jgi:uncharacterized protein YndB with AHSA1/START domain
MTATNLGSTLPIERLSYKRTFFVPVSAQRAFSEFTNPQGGWWPHDHQRGPEPVLGIGVEAKVGGEWYERTFSGARVRRGTVLVWEPPRRLVLSWPLNLGQNVDMKALGESELEIQFIPYREEVTWVDLEHRDMQRTPDIKKLRPFFSPYGYDLLVYNFYAYLASEPWPHAGRAATGNPGKF